MSLPSKWRSRLVTLGGSIGLLAAVGGVIVAIGWAKVQQVQAAMAAPPPPEMPVTVDLFQPRTTSFRKATVVVGSAMAHRSVDLRNEETGVVTEVAMTPGGVVKAGDLLVQIDDRLERAALKSAQATQRQAKTLLARAERLQLAKATSVQELDIALADAERAAAEVERLQVMIDRKRIRAQFDARVGLFDLHPGQYLAAGTDIVSLEGVADYLNVDFAVPGHIADQIAVGDSVVMRPNSYSAPLSASVVAMDSRADAVSRSLTVRARLDSPPETLVPGDSVLVTVEFGPQIEAILVPQTAIRRGPSGTTVFLAKESPNEDGTTSLRATAVGVALGGSDGTMARVVGGLSLDDLVVTDGSFKVFEGSLLGPIDAVQEGQEPLE